eukprot:CAMPEP_0204587486 /NCGR_PEP_ID=MMETSP0661-20131031/48080_1 /ASSEMBLY_ACC=CAM_ASM_000606 /TAXON_ID=109239 /ORGANISM="Alexandrium margalefi, Strain AMGDE01CS-322" /LENGTH=69 /DNA_ID=CAMNT_0051597207 /DNA_START=137 /DNA_END=342 /DNA_ORIENTATION=+
MATVLPASGTSLTLGRLKSQGSGSSSGSQRQGFGRRQGGSLSSSSADSSLGPAAASWAPSTASAAAPES